MGKHLTRIFLAPLIGCFLFVGAVQCLASSAPTTGSDLRIIKNTSGSGTGDDVDLTAYYGKMRGVAFALLLVLLVGSGLMAAAGKPQLAWQTAIGTILLFGASWLVIAIANALNVTSN